MPHRLAASVAFGSQTPANGLCTCKAWRAVRQPPCDTRNRRAECAATPQCPHQAGVPPAHRAEARGSQQAGGAQRGVVAGGLCADRVGTAAVRQARRSEKRDGGLRDNQNRLALRDGVGVAARRAVGDEAVGAGGDQGRQRHVHGIVGHAIRRQGRLSIHGVTAHASDVARRGGAVVAGARVGAGHAADGDIWASR